MRSSDKNGISSILMGYDDVPTYYSGNGSKIYLIDNEDINEIINSSGSARGITLYTDAEYVRRHEGMGALHLVEDEARAMGYPIDYSRVSRMDWYPIALRAISLIAIKKALNWNDEQLREMGRTAPKYSIITKLMLRYLVSLEKLAGQLGSYWCQNYNAGYLTGITGDRKLVLHLSDFNVPPLLESYIQGYFTGVVNMVIGNHHEIQVEQTRVGYGEFICHEFILKW